MDLTRNPAYAAAFIMAVGFACLTLASCERWQTEKWEKAPLAPGQIEVVDLPALPGLKMQRIRYFSTARSEPRFMLVLSPASTKPSGVLIFNHGWFDRPEQLISEIHIDRVFLDLLTRNEIRPVYLVLPDVRFSRVNPVTASKEPFPSYLPVGAEEIPSVVSKQYGIPLNSDQWGMGGFSFGGYMSLDIGRRYSGRFGSISVISSFYEDDWLFWPASVQETNGGSEGSRGRQTVVDPGPRPRLLLMCGTDDRFYKKMVSLHEKFTAEQIAHGWRTAPGGHTWKYWATTLEPMMRFHFGTARAAARR